MKLDRKVKDQILHIAIATVINREWDKIQLVLRTNAEKDEVVNEVFLRVKEQRKSIGNALREYLMEVQERYAKEISVPPEYFQNRRLSPELEKYALEVIKETTNKEVSKVEKALERFYKDCMKHINKLFNFIVSKSHFLSIWKNLPTSYKEALKGLKVDVDELKEMEKTLKQRLHEDLREYLKTKYLIWLHSDRKKWVPEDLRKSIELLIKGRYSWKKVQQLDEILDKMREYKYERRVKNESGNESE